MAPDGRRFAWRGAGQIRVGHLGNDVTILTDSSTPAPARGAPVALAATAVLLGYSQTGGGLDTWDVWVPERGAYVASSTPAEVLTVYGPAPGGHALLGLVAARGGGKEPCLALLDPMNGLRATATACGLPLYVDHYAAVSPDGRWPATLVLAGATYRVVLLDLRSVFERPAIAVTWDAGALGVGVGATTMVVSDNGRLLRCRVGGASCEPVTAPGLPAGAAFDLVPRLTP